MIAPFFFFCAHLRLLHIISVPKWWKAQKLAVTWSQLKCWLQKFESIHRFIVQRKLLPSTETADNRKCDANVMTLYINISSHEYSIYMYRCVCVVTGSINSNLHLNRFLPVLGNVFYFFFIFDYSIISKVQKLEKRPTDCRYWAASKSLGWHWFLLFLWAIFLFCFQIKRTLNSTWL